MYTDQEATRERQQAYLGALEREAEGYRARLAALADGKGDRLPKAQLESRGKQVEAEIARTKKRMGSKPRDEDGAAELPEGEPSEEWTVPQLRAYVEEHGLDVKTGGSKASILEGIEEAQASS